MLTDVLRDITYKW